jgi:hypothetical protein
MLRPGTRAPQSAARRSTQALAGYRPAYAKRIRRPRLRLAKDAPLGIEQAAFRLCSAAVKAEKKSSGRNLFSVRAQGALHP